MSKELISKIYLIVEKIEYIEQVIEKSGNITNALDDAMMARPAILMHLTAIAEQFNKLKKEDASNILSNFEQKDLKGLYDIRNYIAHDYEGVNLAIIEWVIRYGLPKFKKECENIIQKS